jgi:nitrate reductase NapD
MHALWSLCHRLPDRRDRDRKGWSMNICGVLVHAKPGRAAEIADALNALPNAEVHQITDDNRLIVTVEEADDRTAGDTVLAMHRIQGVLSAALVYHHFEPDQEPDDAAVEA